MTTIHKPVTAEVREGFAFYLQGKIAGATFGQGLAEFDAWLADHDAEVRDQCARTVEALNAEYRDVNDLDGQRGFSVEVAGLIRSLDKRA